VAKRVGAEVIKSGMIKKGCAFAKFKHNNDPERLNLLIEKIRWEPLYFDLI
jgi:malate dehydrogenase (oxaloacetate-decarboxylating)